MQTIENRKYQEIAEAKLGARQYLDEQKLLGAFHGAMDDVYENEGYIEVFALILAGASLEEIRAAAEKHAFSDQRMESEIERDEDMAYQRRAEDRRYDLDSLFSSIASGMGA